MTGPDRIWIIADTSGVSGEWQCGWCQGRPNRRHDLEHIRRDHAVIAALPEVQALIAAARLDYRKLVAAISGNQSGTKCDACRNCGMIHCADAFYGCSGMRDYTPTDATAALAARDAAMIARGMREAAGIDWTSGRDVSDTAPNYLSDWQRGLVAGQNAMRDAILARAAEIERGAK